MLTLLVLEGPAGCGKSYVQSLLAEKGVPPVNPLVKLPRPRDYGMVMGRYLSGMRDYQTLFELAILNSAPNHQRYITTRFLFSQLVYHSLRIGDDMVKENQLRIYLNQFAQLYGPTVRSLQIRGGFSGDMPVQPLRIHFHFIQPTLDYLVKLRHKENDPTKYPFDPVDEIFAYNKLYPMIRNFSEVSLGYWTQTSHVEYSFSGATMSNEDQADILADTLFNGLLGPITYTKEGFSQWLNFLVTPKVETPELL